VVNIEIIDNKKCRQIAEKILFAMRMRWYNAGRIAQWSTSWALLEATGCRHRASACTALPKRLPRSLIFAANTNH
jgi:hypothetical protein